MSMEAIGNDWGDILFYILTNLIITLIGYGILPLLMARFTRRPITKKKFHARCFGWNVIPALFFRLMEVKNSTISVTRTFGPYFLWTAVFCALGLKLLESRGMLEDADPAPDPNQAYRCRACGYQSRGYFEACPRCGKFGKEIVTDEVLPLPRYHYCSSCGKPLAPGVRFCGHCGSRVQEKE